MTNERGPTPALRPEATLLACVSRTHIDAEARTRIDSALREGVDWDDVIGSALTNGVIPLLHRNLSVFAPHPPPEAALETIRFHAQANAARNLVLTRELVTVLDILAARGIPVIPFKGPVLAALVYGDITSRVFSDLDFLIRRADVTAVCEVLEARGYRDVTRRRLNDAQSAAYRFFEAEYDFIRSDGIMFEPHWAITPREFVFPIEGAGLWERARPVAFHGTTVLALAPEDLLIVLCAHGGKDLWRALKWVADVAEVVRAYPSIDWAAMLARARVLGGERMLLLGLLLANWLSGAHLPDEVWRRVRRDGSVEGLARRVPSRLFRRVGSRPTSAEHLWFHLRMRERMRDRARHLVRALTAPRFGHLVRLPLPPRLFFLYAVVLPFWKIGKHVSVVVRRASRAPTVAPPAS